MTKIEVSVPLFSEIEYLILKHKEDSRSSEEDLNLQVDSTKSQNVTLPFGTVEFNLRDFLGHLVMWSTFTSTMG